MKSSQSISSLDWQKTGNPNSRNGSRKGISDADFGLLVAMASMGMLFGAFLLSVLFSRARLGEWPPRGVNPLNPELLLFSTAFLILSSVVLHVAYLKAKNEEVESFFSLWKKGVLCALGFVLVQVAALYSWWTSGSAFAGNLYNSSVYFLILFHGAHALVGFTGLLLSPYQMSLSRVKLWLNFWHFVDIVWLITLAVLVL